MFEIALFGLGFCTLAATAMWYSACAAHYQCAYEAERHLRIMAEEEARILRSKYEEEAYQDIYGEVMPSKEDLEECYKYF